MRYEWPCPGQLLHIDVKKFARFTEPGHKTTGDRTRRSRRAGWEYLHSIVDDYSRLAYSEIREDERAETVRSFTERALDFYLEHGIVAERLMTDNHMSYRCSRSFAQLLTLARSSTSEPDPTRPAPTGRWSASSKLSLASGPTPCNTPQAQPVKKPCHTGSTTTTSDATTQPSATSHPSPAFGTSSGTTASSRS